MPSDSLKRRADGHPRGLAIIEQLGKPLADHQPRHAARAALLAMTGNSTGAPASYQNAIVTAPTPAEALFLRQRLACLN